MYRRDMPGIQFLPDYLRAKDLEEDRWWKENRRPFFAVYTPRLTIQHEQRDIDRLRLHLKHWTVRWWESRNHEVIFDDTGKTDGFYVKPIKSNEQTS